MIHMSRLSGAICPATVPATVSSLSAAASNRRACDWSISMKMRILWLQCVSWAIGFIFSISIYWEGVLMCDSFLGFDFQAFYMNCWFIPCVPSVPWLHLGAVQYECLEDLISWVRCFTFCRGSWWFGCSTLSTGVYSFVTCSLRMRWRGPHRAPGPTSSTDSATSLIKSWRTFGGLQHHWSFLTCFSLLENWTYP